MFVSTFLASFGKACCQWDPLPKRVIKGKRTYNFERQKLVEGLSGRQGVGVIY
jgi:hypothetical protein